MTSETNPFAVIVAGALDDDAERDALVRRCVGALAHADSVVSVPSLCNRLWLGWGIDGYENAAASALIDAVPGVAHNEPELPGHTEPERDRPGPQPAVALGAIVDVRLGRRDPAYAEVVYKEGAHRALNPNWVPNWLAGAPALPDTEAAPPPDYEPDAIVVLRERLVLDFGCFGASFAPSAHQWDNLRRKQRYVDAFGHLIVHARYEPGDDADDLTYWARWVVAHYPAALDVAGIPPDPATIRLATTQLAEAVGAHDDVRVFGPYLLHAECYDRLVAGGPDPDRYDRVAHGLARPYHRDRRGWASMSERLVTELDDEMVGTGWADHVVAASVRTLELLAEEAPTGDWNGVHLRLDDDWQGGGLWRTELLTAAAPIVADPALALGLGWAEHAGRPLDVAGDPDVDTKPDDWGDEHASTPLADHPDLADGAVGLLGDQAPSEDATPFEDATALDDEPIADLESTQLTWTLHVTGADITACRLRVPARAIPLLKAALTAHGQEELLIVFDHDQVQEMKQWSSLVSSRERTHLRFGWPPLLRAGTTLEVSWGFANLVVRAQSQLLAEPEYIDGVEFTHVFNEQVALAALGHRPPTQTVTLERLVRAVIRRHGAVFEDGRRCLSVDEIVDGCFGPAGQVAPDYGRPVLARAVGQAIAQMVRSGRAQRDGDLVLIEETTRASRAVDRELLNRFVDSTAQRLRRAVSRSWVAPGIMNLTFYRPSAAKRASWGEVRGTEGLPDADLGPGQTWRKGHLRNGALAADVARSLERASKAAADLGATEEHQAKLAAAVHDHYDQTRPAGGGTPA